MQYQQVLIQRCEIKNLLLLRYLLITVVVWIVFFLQIHKSTINSCGLPHLSVSETKLVRYPELLPEYLASVHENSMLMETHMLWRRKSHVFWEWMVRAWRYVILCLGFKGKWFSFQDVFIQNIYSNIKHSLCCLIVTVWFLQAVVH